MNNIYYLQKSAGGTNQVTLKSKLLENRVVFLDDEVNSETVNSVISQMSLLCIENTSEPITLLINSPGGSIQDGLVLIDVMRSLPCAVRTVSLGIAASMAAVILAAGSQGQRYITESSRAMLHQPLLSGSIPGGNCSEIETVAKSLIERKEQLNKLLVKLTGKPMKVINSLTSKDSYLNSNEALEYGLVDKVADGKTLYKLITGGLI